MKNDKKFKIGDRVYAEDWCVGIIIDLGEDYAIVEFEDCFGGGNLSFKLENLQHAED